MCEGWGPQGWGWGVPETDSATQEFTRLPQNPGAPTLEVLGGGHPGNNGTLGFPLMALFCPLASRLSSMRLPPYVREATRTQMKPNLFFLNEDQGKRTAHTFGEQLRNTLAM